MSKRIRETIAKMYGACDQTTILMFFEIYLMSFLAFNNLVLSGACKTILEE